MYRRLHDAHNDRIEHTAGGMLPILSLTNGGIAACHTISSTHSLVLTAVHRLEAGRLLVRGAQAAVKVLLVQHEDAGVVVPAAVPRVRVRHQVQNPTGWAAMRRGLFRTPLRLLHLGCMGAQGGVWCHQCTRSKPRDALAAVRRGAQVK